MGWAVGMLGTVEEDPAVEGGQKQTAQEKSEKAMTPSPGWMGAGIGVERHSASAERPTSCPVGRKTTGYMAKGLGRWVSRALSAAAGRVSRTRVSRTGVCHGRLTVADRAFQAGRPAENCEDLDLQDG